jgi:shikimate kinase
MIHAEKKLERPIVLTGFMGVGKSTVARHLAYLLRANRIDLDRAIEEKHGRSISEIVTEDGEAAFREIESAALKLAIESTDAQIISLGGGTWTFDHNRRLIKGCNCQTIWLNAPFEHCWRNIQLARGKRPLLQNKENARQLYDDRIRLYCLAEWHFVIQPDQNSIDVAKQILEEIF